MNVLKTFQSILLATLYLLLFTTTGCELIGPEEEDEDAGATGVYVVNQGNFTDGNGSITIYDAETGTVSGETLDDFGSILQSITFHDGLLYVLGNTGDRIDVIDAATNERVAQINGVVSPRYMAVGPNGKGYVTSFYGAPGSFTGGMVTVIDLNTHKKLKEIQVGSNPEGITIAGNLAYVANYSSETTFGAGNTLSVIDTGKDVVVRTITLDCDAPRMLITDRQNEVYVFCTGQILYDENFNEVGRMPGSVRVLNGATGEVVKGFEIDGRIETVGPGQDVFYSPEREEVIAVKDAGSLLRYNTRNNTFSGEIDGLSGHPIGAVALDAASGRIFLGRVAGYTERGSVTIHDETGNQIGQFNAGISPTFITFRPGE